MGAVIDWTNSWQSLRGRALVLGISDQWVPKSQEMDSISDGYIDFIYSSTREIKMGVEKRKQGVVGFARILCLSTQLFGQPLRKNKDTT